MIPLRIGFGVPRSVGDPSAHWPMDRREMLRRATGGTFGFDSVWVPDHFYFEWPPGAFEPLPEAWTLMMAVGATSNFLQIGSMVLAAAFRPPAMLARMAATLQRPRSRCLGHPWS